MTVDNLSQKRICVLGLGLEGTDVILYLLANHINPNQIGVADAKEYANLPTAVKNILTAIPTTNYHFGKSYLESLHRYDVIIKSPGIPAKTLPHLAIPITSSTDIFFSSCIRPIIGITGTKGKSTTTSIIDHVLSVGGIKTTLVGNIGKPFLSALSAANQSDVVVAELSSHQLVDVHQSPHIAVLLNLYREHLDYYKSFNEYKESKFNIVRHQTPNDLFVYHTADSFCQEAVKLTPATTTGFDMQTDPHTGCYLSNDTVIYQDANQPPEEIIQLKDIPLTGSFNAINCLPAIIIAKHYNIPTSTIRDALTKFTPLKHRLEKVGEVNGITFIDDVLATIPEAAIAALRSLEDQVDTIMLGGSDRDQDFTSLVQFLLTSKVRNIILFPPTGARIASTIQRLATNHRLALYPVKSMEEAVNQAIAVTQPGKVCLLSPAAPSFGLFANYEDKANQFVACITAFNSTLQ